MWETGISDKVGFQKFLLGGEGEGVHCRYFLGDAVFSAISEKIGDLQDPPNTQCCLSITSLDWLW